MSILGGILLQEGIMGAIDMGDDKCQDKKSFPVCFFSNMENQDMFICYLKYFCK